ncbi:bifunctional adenosylcobinamide kinase/adenosylcobinamide-phosphate guanylyltransferase [Desulfobulbus rhabdoformis]|uniref:bifunctional adenosylcobinamide kinase/adenosylcobinamide-phosphate guanylyltransferase n=1 Tax=Desulfobulbus rhabdoformis TaxID=34032 RepID=UPI001965E3F0|nr:bifunctional adenosylcobinamide kinase/adenosylcobinamide-phosphate guanylyltransferase [Desulfobulbus rhabdoformis]MBM9616790.1 bifunctional adenosylcobinamide kinase/adenosylcobinamide-phosphate guanylyltransferase [Desulfobulbus rhabdoformis]
MGRLTLITGGARSGKSSFAEELIAQRGQKIGYIATARPFDAEMEDRIAKHRLQRPSAWQTFETPTNPAQALLEHGNQFDALLLDCMTVMITNRILTHDIDWDQPSVDQLNQIETDILAQVSSLLAAASKSKADLVAVTNEVGYGIVPLAPLSRFFRDCAGRVNQRMAAAADDVFLVVSGIPMQVKGANQ